MIEDNFVFPLTKKFIKIFGLFAKARDKITKILTENHDVTERDQRVL